MPGLPRQLRPRNLLIAGAALLVIALLVPFVTLNRYRRSVARLLGAALERTVEVGGVHLQMLPWPAVVAENVSIGERPEVGIEPVARMTELRITLRLRSLWTGRPEVSSLVCVEPSVNLVRGDFLEASRQTPGMVAVKVAAPTPANDLHEFPYIELRDGRINFKRDDVKSVFFFTDVDAAVYRQNGNLYVRFRGTPARTDRAITGAGEVRVEGALLPRFDLQARLGDAFLRDVLALVTGADPGVQGSLNLDMRITGHPVSTRLEGRVNVSDLHRADTLPPSSATPLQASFSATADIPARHVELAEARSDAGTITAFGQITASNSRPLDWDLQLRLDGADGGKFFAALSHLSPRLSGDLHVSGLLDGKVHFSPSAEGPISDGEILVQNFAVRAGTLAPMTAQSARLVFSGPTISLEPVRLAIFNQRPLTVSVASDWTTPVRGPRMLQVAASGTDLSFEYLSPLAASLGLSGWPTKGRVTLNAKLTTERDQPAALAGTADLSRVVWEPAWLARPVALHNLRVEMGPKRIRGTGLVAEAGGSMITGSIERLPADHSGPSRWQADLHVDDVTAGNLAAMFATNRPLPDGFGNIQASGKIAASVLHLRGLEFEEMQSAFSLADRKVVLRDARARISGGRASGKVGMNFVAEPSYDADVKLTDVESSKLTALSEGPISGAIRVTTHGRTARELASALTVAGDFVGRSIRIQDPALSQALRMERAGAISAEVDVRDEVIHFTRLSLSGPPLLEASGTVNFDRRMDLDFQAFRLTGTLAEPRRIPAGETELRPDWRRDFPAQRAVENRPPDARYVLASYRVAQQHSPTQAELCASAEAKIAALQAASEKPPDKRGGPVTLTQPEIEAFFALSKVPKLPAGVSGIRFEIHPDKQRAWATVDFDQYKAAQKRPVNPLLELVLQGKRTIRAEGRAMFRSEGMGEYHLDEAALDQLTVRGGTIQFLLKWFVLPRYPKAEMDKPFTLPSNIRKIDIREGAIVVYP